MDQVIEIERIDLARIQPSKAIAYALQQQQQLLLVIPGDRLARSATLRTLTTMPGLLWS